MKSFKKINRAGTGFVIDYVNDAGGLVRDYVFRPMGAVIPPIAGNPGYYLFLGILFSTVPEGPQKLIFMAEGEHLVRNQLIKELNDEGVRLMIDSVYADIRARGFYVSLHNSRHSYDLRAAASPENVDYGDSLVQEVQKLEAIEIPAHSILCQQVFDPITGINKTDDIKDPKLFAFHALRFILAGIERDVDLDNAGDVYRDMAGQKYHSTLKPNYGEQSASGTVL